MRVPKLSRRSLGRLLAGGAGAALVGGFPLRAQALSAGDRRFIFLFAKGGWDPTYVFAPLFDSATIDMPERSEVTEVNGVSYVAASSRPSVDAFFEGWGDRACIVNGIEVPSVSHDRCTRLTLTGKIDETGDDVGAILGANAAGAPLMPHSILTGPGFAGSYAGSVVRVGENAQLPELLDGTALERSDEELVLSSGTIEEAVDTFVRERANALAQAQAFSGQGQHWVENTGNMLTRVAEVGTQLQDLELSSARPSDLANSAVALLAQGLSRSVMFQHLGLWDQAWDSHAINSIQDNHHELYFEVVCGLMAALDATPGLAGGTLADETTVVLLSEMGRSPKLNGQAGKDHWTYTSAVIIGSGVRGGQVVGAYDDYLVGRPIDFGTGEAAESGRTLGVEDMVATLLTLGDVDPAAYLPNAQPLTAVIA